ncbi:hypothetical protein F4779DRAFT_615251 [Xylariaceae sp. FL0662B]|nr:hypothetical protein F4779DRAFT_615251 [Xylariaceae sp. FL0662B]
MDYNGSRGFANEEYDEDDVRHWEKIWDESELRDCCPELFGESPGLFGETPQGSNTQESEMMKSTSPGSLTYGDNVAGGSAMSPYPSLGADEATVAKGNTDYPTMGDSASNETGSGPSASAAAETAEEASPPNENQNQGPEETQKIYTCPTCGMKHDKLGSSKAHIRRTHVGTQCFFPGCGTQEETEELLSAHLKQSHHNVEKVTVEGTTKFLCPWPGCALSFKDRSSATRCATYHQRGLYEEAGA